MDVGLEKKIELLEWQRDNALPLQLFVGGKEVPAND